MWPLLQTAAIQWRCGGVAGRQGTTRKANPDLDSAVTSDDIDWRLPTSSPSGLESQVPKVMTTTSADGYPTMSFFNRQLLTVKYMLCSAKTNNIEKGRPVCFLTAAR